MRGTEWISKRLDSKLHDQCSRNAGNVAGAKEALRSSADQHTCLPHVQQLAYRMNKEKKSQSSCRIRRLDESVWNRSGRSA